MCVSLELVCRVGIVASSDASQRRRLSDDPLRRSHSRLGVVAGEVASLRSVRDVGGHRRTASRQRPACPTGRRHGVPARSKQGFAVDQRPSAGNDRVHARQDHEERQRSTGSRQSLPASDTYSRSVFCVLPHQTLKLACQHLPIALAGNVKQSVASVCPSVRLSVRLFPLYRLNRLIFELDFLCVVGHDHSLPEIEGCVHLILERGQFFTRATLAMRG